MLRSSPLYSHKQPCMRVLLFLFLFTPLTLLAQEKLPAVVIKSIAGKELNTAVFQNSDVPLVISFWATWCKPCKKELDAISENYTEWQKETGVKLIAISIDDARSSSKVLPDVKAKGWEYEVYLDENQDFKRAMNVNNVPHTFLVDGNGEIVWSQNYSVIEIGDLLLPRSWNHYPFLSSRLSHIILTYIFNNNCTHMVPI